MPVPIPRSSVKDTEEVRIAEYDEWVRMNAGCLEFTNYADPEEGPCEWGAVENPGEDYAEALHYLSLVNAALGTTFTPEDWDI